jgi:hypothetical protein
MEFHLPSQSLDRRGSQQVGNSEFGSVTVSVAVFIITEVWEPGNKCQVTIGIPLYTILWYIIKVSY